MTVAGMKLVCGLSDAFDEERPILGYCKFARNVMLPRLKISFREPVVVRICTSLRTGGPAWMSVAATNAKSHCIDEQTLIVLPMEKGAWAIAKLLFKYSLCVERAKFI